MFAPRPRKSTEPQDATRTGLKSLSIVRCGNVGTDNNQILVYQILGPPELFNESPNDVISKDRNVIDETLDEFHIRQRKSKLKINEETRVPELNATLAKSNNAPDAVATYGTSTTKNGDGGPCESSLQVNIDEAISQGMDHVSGQDVSEHSGEQSEVEEIATPVCARRPRLKSMSGRSRTPGWHICTHCSYTTTKRYILEKHLGVHREKPRIKCNKCELDFANESALKKHQLSHNTPYRCIHCDGGFSNYKSLESHFMKEHTHATLYNCKECDYSCSRVENMRRHVRSHTGERPYQCPHCFYAAADSFRLKRHILTHLGERPYKCDLCESRFTQINDLKIHKYTHSSTKPHACGKCSSAFTRRSDLRRHERSVHRSRKLLPVVKSSESHSCSRIENTRRHIRDHTGERSHQCPHCAYATNTSLRLKRHILTHLGERPYKCDLCDSRFKSKHHLKYHKDTHTSTKPHACGKCSSAFTRRSDLNRHERSVHRSRKLPPVVKSSESHSCSRIENTRRHIRDQTGERLHQCPHCAYATNTSLRLKRHILTHLGERPYKCDLCDSRFKSKHHLKYHKDTHTSTKPHVCDICSKAFTRLFSLKRHENTVHRS